MGGFTDGMSSIFSSGSNATYDNGFFGNSSSVDISNINDEFVSQPSGGLFSSLNITSGQGFNLVGKIAGGITKTLGNMQKTQDAIDEQSRAMEAANNQAYERQVANRQEQSQRNEQIARAKLTGEMQSAQQKAAAYAAASSTGGMGTQGISVDALMSSFDANLNAYTESLNRQMQLSSGASETSIKNIEKTRKATISGLTKPVYSNVLGDISETISDAYTSYRKDVYNNTNPSKF